MDGKKLVDNLISYAKKNLQLKSNDEIYFSNILASILKVEDYDYTGLIEENLDELPDNLIDELKGYLSESYDNEKIDLIIDFIFSLLSGTPSLINERFKLLIKDNPKNATDYFYNLCVKNGYIKKSAVDKNLFYSSMVNNKRLEFSINLSKPEKDNKQIANELKKEKNDYPKCQICRENEGCLWGNKHLVKSTLRTINLTLGDEKWFYQYSPYTYFNEHCVIINCTHTPMKVDDKTILKLLDFIDLIPHYFVGSNASLPIIGGSILSHEHFQAGNYNMPIADANPLFSFRPSEHKEVECYILDWFLSTIRLKSQSRQQLLEVAVKIINEWTNYTCEEIDVIRATEEEKHNGICPILRKKDSAYELDLVLRNNRVNDNYPDGIFHAHQEYHNVKKEGVGIIESSGLFILPGRLLKEMEDLEREVVLSKKNKNYLLPDNLLKHQNIFDVVKNCKEKDLRESIFKEILNVCSSILDNCRVFKNDLQGNSYFKRFISQIGYEEIK